MTAARRLGAIFMAGQKRWSRWQHARYVLSGAVLAGAVGAGVSLVIGESIAAERKLGFALLCAACFDLASAEGLVWVRQTFLRALERPTSPPDESSDNGT